MLTLFTRVWRGLREIAFLFLLRSPILIVYYIIYLSALKIPDLPRVDGSVFLFGPPDYHFDIIAIRLLLYPIHQIDRWIIRPHKWEYLPGADAF